jgi:hypothetical protein
MSLGSKSSVPSVNLARRTPCSLLRIIKRIMIIYAQPLITPQPQESLKFLGAVSDDSRVFGSPVCGECSGGWDSGCIVVNFTPPSIAKLLTYHDLVSEACQIVGAVWRHDRYPTNFLGISTLWYAFRAIAPLAQLLRDLSSPSIR